MGLLDDLKAAGRALDIQFQPSSNEVQSVVGAVVHYLEHGDSFLKAVESGAEDVGKLLSPQPEPPPAEQPVAPVAAPTGPPGPADPAAVEVPADDTTLSDEELDRRISDLQALQASRVATGQQTTVDHETGGEAA